MIIPRILYCDLESYCEVPIKNGTHAYAEKAEVMLFAYGFDDEPVKVWDLTQDPTTPPALWRALRDPAIMTVWHNGGMFDRTVLRHALGIELPIERVHDTMVQALAHGLPGSLGHLCEIFKVAEDQAKSKRGRELIQLFCKPRPKKQKLRRATRETHPTEWQEFIEYARTDITAMRVLYKSLPRWNYAPGSFERNLWNLDQKINDRGVAVDTELAARAIEAVERAQDELALRAQELTFGDVERATQRDAMLKHILGGYGVALPDLTGATLERRINDPELPWALRELLAIRLQASTTSTAKYKALIKGVSGDDRLRGTLQFCGASRTGRWAGRTFQPQNLPRPTLKQKEIDHGIEAIKNGIADLISANVMQLTSSCIRGCLIAPDGRQLAITDLSNIEGRAAAWLAGEEWKLGAFRAYDGGTGHDLYKLAYAKSFSVTPEEVTKDQRQVGKVQELALGYEGGVGAFVTFALLYRLDLDKLADLAWASIPAHIMSECRQFWGWASKKKQTMGLSERAFIVCDALKRMWREAHPAISSYWKELEQAAVRAVLHKGQVVQARKIKFVCKGAWLRMILPSGRSLCYASPRVTDGKLTYLGVNQYSRQWGRMKTYGGKLFENACQAFARDIMAHNMPKIEAQGFEIVLTVHDELITETEMVAADVPPQYCGEEDPVAAYVSALLAANPEWAPDIPLAASGFTTHRYRKD